MALLPSPRPGRWLGRQQRTGDDAGRQPPVSALPGDFFNTICAGSPRQALEKAAEEADKVRNAALLGAILGGGILIPFGELLAGAGIGGLTAFSAWARDKAASYTGSLGDLLVDAANELVSRNMQWAMPLITEAFIGNGQPAISPQNPDVDFSYAVMDFYNYSDVSCITNADSIEVAFNASDPQLVIDFVEKSVFRHVKDQMEAGRAVGVYCSLRFTARTSAMLGIQKWPRTVVVEVAGLKRFNGLSALLDQLEDDAKRMGATVHWGQRNHLTAADVSGMYPRLPAWKGKLRQFSAYGPPDQMQSAYTVRVGLEP